MTNREFENYLTLVSRLLRLKRGQTDRIAVELRDHLELRVAELIESGVDIDEATRMALEEFGDAASLAGQFQFISETYRRRWMMRFATLSVAGLFLTAVLVMAMWPSGSRFGAPDTSVASESSRSLLGSGSSAAAATKIDDVEMSDATRRTNHARQLLESEHVFDHDESEFIDVLDFLTHKFEGLMFLLDQTARDDSLSYDEPISFKIGPLPLNKALRLMLREHNATYVIRDGIVRIISMDVANDPEFFTRRIFDVEDLLAKIEELESDRIMFGTIIGSSSTSRRKGGGVFSIRQDASEEVSPEQSQVDTPPEVPMSAGAGETDAGERVGAGIVNAESVLIEVIKKTVAADSWDNTNGDGTCEILGGLMIVIQSEEVSEQIEELLQDLNYRFAKRQEARKNR